MSGSFREFVISSAPVRRIVLVGMMGSGKTSLGRELARRTGWPFADNDELLARVAGHTARELHETGGEAALRAAESAALGAALEIAPPMIAAVAAGTILDPADRDRLSGAGLVVWLDAPPDVLAARATGAPHRPWLDDDPVAWFRREHAARAPLYAAVAGMRIDTSRVTPADAAEAIGKRGGIPERFGRAPGT